MGYVPRPHGRVIRVPQLKLNSVGLSAVTVVCAAAVAPAAPSVSTPFASRFQLSTATVPGEVPMPTQMAWGPDNRLYVTRYLGESASFAFNPATGALTDRRATGVVGGFGMAFANHATPDGPTQNYMYVCRSASFQ